MNVAAPDEVEQLADEAARLRQLVVRQQRQLDARGEKIVTLRAELLSARATIVRTREGRAWRTAMVLREISLMRSPRHAVTVLKRVPRTIKRKITR